MRAGLSCAQAESTPKCFSLQQEHGLILLSLELEVLDEWEREVPFKERICSLNKRAQAEYADNLLMPL